MNELDKLRLHLAKITPGAVGETDPIEKLLAASWDKFAGSDQGGMRAYKLLGRAEKMQWNPPVLTFDFERHGAAALGSTLAEIQGWMIDTATGTASVAVIGHRQLRANPNWKAKPVARGLAQLIITDQKDEPRLIWNQDGHVRPDIGSIVPGSNKQTREGRNKRFWAALIAELRPHGWVKVHRRFEKIK